MIRGLLESPAFREFMERVDEKAKEVEATLKGSGDPNELFRAQGGLFFHDFVRSLPEVMILEEEEEKREKEEEEEDI
jgi:hypothetical protein